MTMNVGARRLAKILEDRGAQQSLADELGVDAGIVSRWRTGKLGPGAGSRLQLQERFGIPWQAWDELIDEADADSKGTP